MDYRDYYSGLYRELLQGSIPPFPTKHPGVSDPYVSKNKAPPCIHRHLAFLAITTPHKGT